MLDRKAATHVREARLSAATGCLLGVAAGAVIWALIILAVCKSCSADGLPEDPFRRAATKALRGDFGTLKPWQRQGYERGLAQGVTANTPLVLTAYLGTERDGRIDRRGRQLPGPNGTGMETCASNRIPENSWVWAREELRQVRDCGSLRNDFCKLFRQACRLGGVSVSEAHWVDYWWPNAATARRHGRWGWKLEMGAVIAP